MVSDLEIWSEKIKQAAAIIGFTDCKIAPADELSEDARNLKTWLSDGMHADMHYMENHFEKRTNPEKLLPGSKSVIVVLLNYYPANKLPDKNNFQISKYAYGRDYHKVMKNKLKKLQKTIHDDIVAHEARVFVDSAPLLEKALAGKAGLGWIGKNANLISPVHGSFVFIGEILLNVELKYDAAIRDFCGSCTKCIMACPTNAIVKPYVIDSRRCISYWTIENKGSITEKFNGKFRDMIFGCDICQDVCPWNRKSKPHTIDEFKPSPDLVGMTKEKWINLEEEEFNKLFQNSAVKRTKYEGLMRNIMFVGKKVGSPKTEVGRPKRETGESS